LRCGEERARRAVQELEDDADLRHGIERRLRKRGDHNRRVGYGRRLGWYAIARLVQPQLIVETGIHDGLGSAVLLRALQQNAAEGNDGRLLAFDIRPATSTRHSSSRPFSRTSRIGRRSSATTLMQAWRSRTCAKDMAC